MKKQNQLLCAIIEKDAKTIKYGTASYSFRVSDGAIVLSTLQVTKAIRKKYGRPQSVRTDKNYR